MEEFFTETGNFRERADKEKLHNTSTRLMESRKFPTPGEVVGGKVSLLNRSRDELRPQRSRRILKDDTRL